MGERQGLSLVHFCHNNSIRYIDLDGNAAEDMSDWQAGYPSEYPKWTLPPPFPEVVPAQKSPPPDVVTTEPGGPASAGASAVIWIANNLALALKNVAIEDGLKECAKQKAARNIKTHCNCYEIGLYRRMGIMVAPDFSYTWEFGGAVLHEMTCGKVAKLKAAAENGEAMLMPSPFTDFPDDAEPIIPGEYKSKKKGQFGVDYFYEAM